MASVAPTSTGIAPSQESAADLIRSAAAALTALPEVTQYSLTQLIGQRPEWVPCLGLAVGLTQERLKNELRYAFRTSGWVTLARQRGAELIAYLDERFGLIARIRSDRGRSFTYGDVLVERGGTRAAAGRAIRRGRGVENRIEAVVRSLGLPYELRTRFIGRSRASAPCDLAIPSGKDAAQIVCAAKAFDSTGSKLTDAVREIIEMAECRLPTQFVYAVVDGSGWLGRRADLKRIFDLQQRHLIDGLFTLATLDAFRDALEAASLRLAIPRAVITAPPGGPDSIRG